MLTSCKFSNLALLDNANFRRMDCPMRNVHCPRMSIEVLCACCHIRLHHFLHAQHKYSEAITALRAHCAFSVFDCALSNQHIRKNVFDTARPCTELSIAQLSLRPNTTAFYDNCKAHYRDAYVFPYVYMLAFSYMSISSEFFENCPSLLVEIHQKDRVTWTLFGLFSGQHQ